MPCGFGEGAPWPKKASFRAHCAGLEGNLLVWATSGIGIISRIPAEILYRALEILEASRLKKDGEDLDSETKSRPKPSEHAGLDVPFYDAHLVSARGILLSDYIAPAAG